MADSPDRSFSRSQQTWNLARPPPEPACLGPTSELCRAAVLSGRGRGGGAGHTAHDMGSDTGDSTGESRMADSVVRLSRTCCRAVRESAVRAARAVGHCQVPCRPGFTGQAFSWHGHGTAMHGLDTSTHQTSTPDPSTPDLDRHFYCSSTVTTPPSRGASTHDIDHTPRHPSTPLPTP